LTGWGVTANVDIPQGAFLLEYRGVHMLHKHMAETLKQYEVEGLLYVFEYDFNGTRYWYVYIFFVCSGMGL